MNRAAVSVFFVGALILGATACGDHEASPTPTTFVFEPPTATLSVTGTGLECKLESGEGGCELASGSVVSVENTDDVDHHLVGTNSKGGNVFDTGRMQPDDEMTLVLTADGTVTVTDLLWPEGDSPTIDITVTPADTDA